MLAKSYGNLLLRQITLSNYYKNLTQTRKIFKMFHKVIFTITGRGTRIDLPYCSKGGPIRVPRPVWQLNSYTKYQDSMAIIFDFAKSFTRFKGQQSCDENDIQSLNSIGIW